MKNDKNTDDLIRKKLEGFLAPPPPHIWDNVRQQLAMQQKSTRILYMRWAAVAALVLLAFLGGWYFSNEMQNPVLVSTETKTVQPENDLKQTTTDPFVVEEELDKNAENQSKKIIHNLLIAGITEEPFTKIQPANKSVNSRNLTHMEIMPSKSSRFGGDPFPQPNLDRKPVTYSEVELTSIEELIIAQNIKMAEKNKKESDSWQMGMYIAPGYSSYSASHTESYTKNMTYPASDGNMNMSGGFSVQYKTGKRWRVESGVYYAQNGQKSENSLNLFALNSNSDMLYAPSPDTKYFSNAVQIDNGNLSMNSTAGVIAFSQTPKGATIEGNFEASKAGVSNMYVPDGSFSQVFEFVEIPIYVRYRVFDKRFGVEVLTGISAGFVVGNNAYVDNQYGVQNVGSTQDISTVNFSGALGLGASYALGKHLSIALEPRLNYYLNSINNNPSIEFRPYRIGFYTGLTYGF